MPRSDALRSVPAGLSPGGRYADWDPQPPGLVALDVDGTLVEDEDVPAPELLAAIADLVDRGVLVGLATGRMASATDRILSTGVLSGPHVFHNGAMVSDGEGTERHVAGLSDADVDAVLAFGRGRDDLAVEVYVGATYLADRADPRSRPHVDLLGVAPSGVVRSSADLGGRPAVKAVVVCFAPTLTAEVEAAVRALGLEPGPAASPATPGLRYVNVTRRGVDKGHGVAAAARVAGVPLGRVAFVGDERNDLPALALAGTAVAMGGSPAEVRAAAHLVAPPFAEGGTAVALAALAALAGHGVDGTGDPQRAPGTW